MALGCGGGSANAGDTDTDSAGTDGSDSSPGTDATGTDSDTDGETDSDTDDPTPEGFVPPPGGMRKLTTREYISSVELMLGDAAATAAIPPDDIAQEGFDAVGAAILALPADTIELYERSATAVADAVVTDPSTIQGYVPCVEEGANAACYREVATTIGRLAYRRTLSQDEIEALAAIGAAGQQWADDGSFMTGLRYQLMGILQAPSFLYIQEVGEVDDDTGFRRLTGTELATRVSFFLTGHTPTLELLDAAESGALDDPDELRTMAEAMVANPEARTALESFFAEAYRLRSLAEAPKNAELFPNFTPELGEMMKNETLLLLYDIVWDRDADFRELFNARHTYVNDQLAELYGIDSPGSGELYTRVDWPANQRRAGYTSQASFLTWQSGPRRNSPTKRGLYIQERILCNEIPPPDPSVELDLPDGEGLTLKELLEMHLENPGCASCHGLTDPLGFAFENYDAVGAFRTEDNGLPIETDGEVAGIGMWTDAEQLGDILAADPRTGDCLIENFMRGSLGQTPTDDTHPAVVDLGLEFADSGYSVQSLLVDMVAHPLFRLVDEPK
ncbi:MAG: DUF1592 domain-containing protein [Nannocystaceae bacterium]|nr:DUF1592 domain-containing protein [bacterium]